MMACGCGVNYRSQLTIYALKKGRQQPERDGYHPRKRTFAEQTRVDYDFLADQSPDRARGSES